MKSIMGGLFPVSECCVVMQISMRIQIWVLVSMMDFMPGKGEHETCIFLPCQRDVTHQYKQIQNGGTETM